MCFLHCAFVAKTLSDLKSQTYLLGHGFRITMKIRTNCVRLTGFRGREVDTGGTYILTYKRGQSFLKDFSYPDFPELAEGVNHKVVCTVCCHSRASSQ